MGILDTDITTQFPVKISQTKSRFERLITRHGQWVRWRTARKCPCVSQETKQPDPHCEKCGGNGEIYGYQKTCRGTARSIVRDNVMELPSADYKALRVYDSATGAEFTFNQAGAYLEITGGDRAAEQNETLECLYEEPLVKTLASASLEKVGNGFYRVAGVETESRKLEGVYYRAPGDVLAVQQVIDTGGENIPIIGYRLNMIQVNSDSDALTAYGIDYILPVKFAVLSQEREKGEPKFPPLIKGDAVCTFPAAYNVSEGDVLTILSGTETGKDILTRKSADADDVIPKFFVAAVRSVETRDAAYQEGTDFILTGTNRVHWLTDNKPETGTIMSVVYQYNPTYRVARGTPNLRTSEDQRMPRRVPLELFSAFQESRRVNQNG